MGAKSSKEKRQNTDTRWNNIKTDNMSATVPNLNNLSKDAKKLIASLNLPHITETATSEFTVNHIMDKINSNLNKEDKVKFNQILDSMTTPNASENFSNTSPFITEEMYNSLINSETSDLDNNITMKGGAFKSRKSSSSSTSSTSELEKLDSPSSSSSSELHKKKKHHKKEKHHKSRKVTSSESSAKSEVSGGNLSYVSSSAHTEGSESNKASEKSNVSVTNENTMVSTSISVNTSDINMVSDY
jgi:hypothetical protein